MNTASGSLGRAVRHPPFVAGAAVLLAATVFAGPVATRLRLVLRKEPVPLRKPLVDLDRDALGDYHFVQGQAVKDSVANNLGATDYASWRLVDTTVAKKLDPLRHVHCFVSFTTGKRNAVPHIPDACYLGTGYQIVEAGGVDLEVPSPDANPLEVPVRVVTFMKSEVFERATPTVVYTFHCNGQFFNTRDQVRMRLGNPFDKGAYFCKVEVSFGGPGCAPRHPTRPQTIEASGKFLSQLLPVLLRDHLPDWEAFQQGDAAE